MASDQTAGSIDQVDLIEDDVLVSSWFKIDNTGRDEGVIEDRDIGCEQLNRLGAKLLGEELAERTAIVDVQPFRRGDEASDIARSYQFKRFQEEMQVQA